MLLAYPAVLLGLAGDWRWTEGWLFSAWFLALSFGTILHLLRHDPSLLAERLQRPGTAGQKGWDAFVVAALLVGFLAWIGIMPLDAKRYGWSGRFPLAIRIVGAGALVASSFFFFRAFAENTFLSPLVRIQGERGQRVISTGVYAFVRHPMYLGAVLLFLGAPALLGSNWGFVVGGLLVLLVAGRIVGEERMLVAELEGYAEYRRRVRYRLVPGIW